MHIALPSPSEKEGDPSLTTRPSRGAIPCDGIAIFH